MEKIERGQLLSSALQQDQDYRKAEEIRKEEHYLHLRRMNEENLKLEKNQRSNVKTIQEQIDRHSLEQGIKIADAQ